MSVYNGFTLICYRVPCQYFEHVLRLNSDRRIDDSFFELAKKKAGSIPCNTESMDDFSQLLVVEIVAPAVQFNFKRLPDRVPTKVILLQEQDLC